jgi:hypothetical protein
MMSGIDQELLDYAQADIAALAHLPKTYAQDVPAWAGQVGTLPGPCTGAAAGPLCNGWNVTVAAYGQAAGNVRGTDAFAYLWRRFGPPWRGSDDHKDLVGYVLYTAHPDVFLSLHLSASTLPYCVGYVITHAFQNVLYEPSRAWEEQFEGWWMTRKLNERERAAVRCQSARGERAAVVPLVRGLRDRYWQDRETRAIIDEAEAALGPCPRANRRASNLDICTAIHDALIECLRPVFIRDVAINIFGHVPDDQLDRRQAAEHSIYAGYGMNRAALDALRAADGLAPEPDRGRGEEREEDEDDYTAQGVF